MLHETYRPTDWTGFAGNPGAVATAKRLIGAAGASGSPLAVWIDGPSGAGKTTLARIMAGALGCGPMSVDEVDGQGFTAERVRELESGLHLRPLDSLTGWRGVIVNEAHAMTAGAVQRLLTLLERLPKRRFVAFTTTEGRKSDMFGAFDGPLKSRTLHLPLTNQGLREPFAERAASIAIAAGLAPDSPETRKACVRLVKEANGNLREVLGLIEAGALLASESVPV